MIYLIVFISFIFISGNITIIFSVLKIMKQYRIKNKRLEILKNQADSQLIKINLFQLLSELYTETFSHYITYVIGHFSNILLDIYSIIFSIFSLSMVSSDSTDDITKIISLLSTVFVIILVLSKLNERSRRHFFAWKKCENIIAQICKLLDTKLTESNYEQIFSLITTFIKDK